MNRARLHPRNLFVFAIFFLLTMPAVWAHDPFDGVTRMLVHDDTLEIEITMGYDAARELLRGAGVPNQDVSRATRVTDATDPVALPLIVASRLFEVKAGDDLVEATSCVASPAQDESIFLAVYPRPRVGMLSVRASYFSTIQYMRAGSFVARDENARVLAQALLSVDSASLTVPLAGDDALPSENSSMSQPRFMEYLRMGVDHILAGIDHLLFLCALLVGVRRIRPMLGIITCFTLGHSVTLALAALNLVTIPSRVIEPLIAASIIVVGLENLFRPNLPVDRYLMAGGFGLIHGFGFASALRETGLGQVGSSILMPVFSFNLGVEFGQLLVALVVVPLLFFLRRQATFAHYGVPAISVVVILVSGYWLLERTVFAP